MYDIYIYIVISFYSSSSNFRNIDHNLRTVTRKTRIKKGTAVLAMERWNIIFSHAARILIYKSEHMGVSIVMGAPGTPK